MSKIERTLLDRLKRAYPISDKRLAQILDMAPSTVTAYRLGYTPEYFDLTTKRRILALVYRQTQMLAELKTELEIML